MQFDHAPKTTGNRMGYLPPIDNVSVQRELIGFFFERPEATTAEIVAEFQNHYGEKVVRWNINRLADKGYISRPKRTEPWHLNLGKRPA